MTELTKLTVPNSSAALATATPPSGVIDCSEPIGASITGISLLVFFFTVLEAYMKKRVAGDNPWGQGATTLEWTLSSPPPFHQFNTLPVITAQPQAQSVAAGANVSLSVTAAGTAPLSYQWYKDGSPLLGRTTVDLEWQMAREWMSGTYWVQATNSVGSVVTVRLSPLGS